MQLQSNTLLQGGKYRIEKVLGSGGFGITYLATQVALGRKVAIKEFFMKEYCNRDSETSHVSVGSEGSREQVGKFKVKFIKEAQTIAGLNHPHIIRIHDIFEENGTAYYVMEYWDNGSLADYVKDRGKLSEAEALHYVRQVADALGYIHDRKMNHLDVKPGNILLDANKNAVLIDFGLSKRYDAEGNQTSTTPVGISHGYAPLEQYKKGGVGTFSPATDIYSLGATLYKLLTGQTPPEANDVMDEGLPALPASVSPATAAAIEKAMQSSRKNRPQSVKEFLSALNGSSSATSSPQSVPKSKPRPTVDEETEIWNPSYVETEEKKGRKEEVMETPCNSEATDLYMRGDENIKMEVGRDEKVTTGNKGNTFSSAFEKRNGFVNRCLIVAFVVDVFFGLFVFGSKCSYVGLETSIGIAVGIMALFKNKRWGFDLMVCSTIIGCLVARTFADIEMFIMLYMPIWMILAIVFFIKENNHSVWSILENNHKTLTRINSNQVKHRLVDLSLYTALILIILIGCIYGVQLLSNPDAVPFVIVLLTIIGIVIGIIALHKNKYWGFNVIYSSGITGFLLMDLYCANCGYYASGDLFPIWIMNKILVDLMIIITAISLIFFYFTKNNCSAWDAMGVNNTMLRFVPIITSIVTFLYFFFLIFGYGYVGGDWG